MRPPQKNSFNRNAVAASLIYRPDHTAKTLIFLAPKAVAEQFSTHERLTNAPGFAGWANELGNSWGNLSYQPQDYNRMRGNMITKNAMDKLLQYKNEGMLPQRRIDEIIRTATKVPAHAN